MTIRPDLLLLLLLSLTHRVWAGGASQDLIGDELTCDIFNDELCRRSDPDRIDWTVAPGDVDTFVNIMSNKTHYDRNRAPGQIYNETTNVHVALYIESISSFQAQTMDFEVDMYLATSWFDKRLRHNSSDPVLAIDVDVAARLWHPDLYFVNSKHATFQTVTTPNFMVLVYKDGYVFKSMRIAVKLSCMMDLKNFPLDEHECPIVLQSYAYVRDVLNLTWFVRPNVGFPISYNPTIVLSDMKIIPGQYYKECSFPYPMFRGHGMWSCLQGIIKMRRLVVFHILQTYFPTTMLVCISWLSFWLDARASPARISLTITTLLTLVSVSNGARQDLPQVSYIKAIDVWLTACTGFIFSVLLEYTVVNHFISKKATPGLCRHRRNTSGGSANMPATVPFKNGAYGSASAGPAPMIRSATRGPCSSCATRTERMAKNVDLMARILFPVSFLVFAITYGAYYGVNYTS